MDNYPMYSMVVPKNGALVYRKTEPESSVCIPVVFLFLFIYFIVAFFQMVK